MGAMKARFPVGDDSRLRGGTGRMGEADQEEVTVAKQRHELKLGKGSAFVKTRLKRLRQEDETWEADFRR